MNTKFWYLYRDGDNSKRYGYVVLKGLFTDKHIERLHKAFNTDTFPDIYHFVPEAIGLKPVSFTALGWKETEMDLPYHEFESLENTTEEATDPRTVEEFVTDVEKIDWICTSLL